MTRVISVQYFAILREQRGRSDERLTTDTKTVSALYDALRAQHGFTLPGDRIRAAVNGEFVESLYTLKDGDEVVFIPPVAGG
jgi:molybdopterin converting factor subunit 1